MLELRLEIGDEIFLPIGDELLNLDEIVELKEVGDHFVLLFVDDNSDFCFLLDSLECLK